MRIGVWDMDMESRIYTRNNEVGSLSYYAASSPSPVLLFCE